MYCCGSNEKKQLGVGIDESITSLVRIPKFDHRVSKVFTGAKHWYILTVDGELYYSGATYDTVWSKDHIAPRCSNGEFVKCQVPLHTVNHIDIVGGLEFSVVRFDVPKREMFHSSFVQSMSDTSSKSNTFVDVVLQ